MRFDNELQKCNITFASKKRRNGVNSQKTSSIPCEEKTYYTDVP